MQALHAMLLAFATSGGGDETVLYDFYADWCGPCQRAMPLVAKLKGEGLPIRKVNYDIEPDLVQRFGVGPIPCFIMVVNGKEVDRFVGVPSEQQLRQMAGLARSGKAGATPRSGTTQPKLPAATARGDSPRLPWSGGDARQRVDAVAGPRRKNPKPADADSLEARLLAATVRLRVDDPDGQAFSHGTGTIVDTRGDEALVVTCAHLFREAKKEGRVRIDLFCEGGRHGVPGRVVGFDLKRDVALVAFRPGMEVTPTPVAGVAYQADEGERVLDVGCSRGDDPTVRRSKITNISEANFPPNIQTAGQPVQGRSGGGLFNTRGEIIGVCFAADPQDDEGLYAPLRSIYAELDRHGLTEVYQRREIDEPLERRLADGDAPSMPEEMPGKMPQVTMPLDLPLPTVDALAGKLSEKERAALQAVQDSASEVVITIKDGQGSRKIVLPKVSPEFVAELGRRQAEALSKHLTAEKTDAPRRRLPWESPPSETPSRSPFAERPWEQGGK